jgi:hypothetical protein
MTEKIIEYALHEGEITKADGNKEWIDGDQLCRLYGLPMCRCIIVNPEEEKEIKEYIPENVIHLSPRSDGNYTMTLD